jgi:hypothetical protein
VATVAFVDVVESTRVAAEVGDRRWRELVGAFRAVVRRRLKHFNGHEVDTAGDGFFAWFESPANALRAAAAISSDVQQLGLEVRAGVHTGELEQIDRRLGGIAAHIGARVMAAAGPAEVLATSTVRELVVGGDVSFEPFGETELKGVPGRWTLHRVTAVAGQALAKPLDPVVAADRRGSSGQVVDSRRRLIWVAGGVLGLVIVGATVWGAGLLGAQPPPSASSSPTAIARPSSTPTQRPTPTSSPSPAPTLPVAVVRIDQFTNKAMDPVRDEHTSPGLNGIEPDSGNLWHVYGDKLVRRDMVTGKQTATFEMPADTWKVSPGFGSIWVGHTKDPQPALIDVLDSTSGVLIERIDPQAGVWDFAVGDRALYLLQTHSILAEVDPFSREIVDRYPTDTETEPFYAGFDDGLLGLVEGRKSRVALFDPAKRSVVETVELPSDGLGNLFHDPATGTYWFADRTNTTVIAFDPATGDSESIGVDDPPHSIVFTLGSAWVAAGSSVYRFDGVTHEKLAEIPMPVGVYAISIGFDQPTDTMWVSSCYGEIQRCHDL